MAARGRRPPPVARAPDREDLAGSYLTTHLSGPAGARRLLAAARPFSREFPSILITLPARAPVLRRVPASRTRRETIPPGAPGLHLPGAPRGLPTMTARPTPRRGVMTATLGQLVDRMARQGLVERRPCPTDRRRRLVEPSPRGRRLLREASVAVRSASAPRTTPSAWTDRRRPWRTRSNSSDWRPSHDERERAGAECPTLGRRWPASCAGPALGRRTPPGSSGRWPRGRRIRQVNPDRDCVSSLLVLEGAARGIRWTRIPAGERRRLADVARREPQ